MASNDSKHNKNTTNSPKKNTAAKALCCTARDPSSDAGPPRVPYFRPHPELPNTDRLRFDHGPYLTESDMHELQDLVPVPYMSDDVERSDDATTSSRSTTRTSVVKLLKKKLSRTSAIFKQSPTKHASPSETSPKRKNPAEKNKMAVSADPLAMSFDPDARQIISPDIVHHLLEDAEMSVSQPSQPAWTRTSRSKESEVLSAALNEEHLSPISIASATPNTLMEKIQTQTLSKPTSSVLGEDQVSNQHSHDTGASPPAAPEALYIRVEPPLDGLLHGKLSFEDTIEIPKTRSASRMSEIALAVDRCFSSSSEYSERVPHMLESLMTAQHDQSNEVPQVPCTNRRLEVEMPRRQPSDASVHLQHMRISQHLRSLSTLSFDSDDLHAHHRTSSGFESLKVPSSWGKVIGRSGASNEEPSSENVRTIFCPAIVVYEDRNTKTGQTQGRLDPQSLSMNVDGPFDQYTQGARSASLAPPTSSTSIGSNYNETAAMWERALTTHQEDRLNPSRTRGSSFSNLSRRSSQREKNCSEVQRKDSVDTTGVSEAAQNGQTSLMLERVNTTLSFDRLQMPIVRMSSTSQPASLSDSQRGSRRASINPTAEARQRSVSSPGPYSVSDNTVDRGPTLQLLVPGGAEFGVVIPNITLSKPTREESSSLVPSSIGGPFDHLLPSERPWARYSSEDRELRNGPASAATGDDVIVRDFQPSTSESPNAVTKMDRLRRKEKAKLRATTIVLKRKLLTDLPSVFKSNATFRRREHGHRTSISTGGTLEYPELELLPPSAPRLPTALDTSHFVTPPRNKPKSCVRNTPSKQSMSASSAASDSHSGTIHDQEPVIQQSHAINMKRSSSILARSYQKHIQSDMRKSSESVSPLDGQGDIN